MADAATAAEAAGAPVPAVAAAGPATTPARRSAAAKAPAAPASNASAAAGTAAAMVGQHYFDVDGEELCLKHAGFQKGSCKHGDACHRSHGTPAAETVTRLKARHELRQRESAAARAGPPKPTGLCVRVGGLQYAAPYDETKVTWIKDKYVGVPLCQVLGEMWRLKRGEQPLEEATKHWRAELELGRVLYRKRKRCIDDPYHFATPDADTPVEAGDAVQIIRHIHERVVPAVDITILYENDSMIAVRIAM